MQSTEPVAAAPSAPRPVARDAAGRFRPGTGKPARRRPGAQRGNYNSAKNPEDVFWRRRVPAALAEFRHVYQLVEGDAARLVADKGGPSNVSFAAVKVAENVQTARACARVALLRGDLANAARFLMLELQGLRALGLERKARPVPSALARLRGERP